MNVTQQYNLTLPKVAAVYRWVADGGVPFYVIIIIAQLLCFSNSFNHSKSYFEFTLRQMCMFNMLFLETTVYVKRILSFSVSLSGLVSFPPTRDRLFIMAETLFISSIESSPIG